jgi:hypothetical protein
LNGRHAAALPGLGPGVANSSSSSCDAGICTHFIDSCVETTGPYDTCDDVCAPLGLTCTGGVGLYPDRSCGVPIGVFSECDARLGDLAGSYGSVVCPCYGPI